jgi:hypothetical protein
MIALSLAAGSAFAQQAPSGALPGVIQRRFEPPPPTPEVLPTPSVPEGAPSEAPPGAADVRFELTGIVLDGMTVYTEPELLPLWRDLLATEVSLAQMYDVAAQITAKYRNDGYILSRAIVPPQAIQAGIVRIQVIEGYVDQVIIEGELDGPRWQVEAKGERIRLLTLSGATPFTVYDTTNVSQQGSHPEVSGFFSSRPDLISNPNAGPRTVEQWVSAGAFRRLNPIADAGQFGDAGRNVVRGPGVGNFDLSLVKTFSFNERVRLQFRAECFNLTNHANFSLPVNDLASPSFGRILEAGPSRLIQFGLKLLF